MRPVLDKRAPAPDLEARRGLVAVGCQGTLIPDPHPAAKPSAEAEGTVCVRELPLEPWLTGALRELDLRVSAEQRSCGGKRIEPGALIEALRDRLRGMLTQVLAISPDATDEQVAHRFPVLAALLKAAVAEWVDAIAVFHRRLHGDAARLAAWLGYAKLPGLDSLTSASSDQHAGGHQAMRLQFADGRCIYYKPRPVSGEWLWDQLVHAVNCHSDLQLASAGTLPGANGRYGWVAALVPHPELHCWDRRSAQARAYWHAAGATLCLAEHVRMSDLHMANVMATGRGPAPVDAESLGTPRAVSQSPAARAAEQEFGAVIDDLRDTGLLPVHDAGGLPDTSGLFGKAAAVPEIMIPQWSVRPDGGQRLEIVPSALVDYGNAPPGATPLEVLPLLGCGYREAANALMRCRERLVSSQSAWRWTLEHIHAPRIVLRDTLTYGILLSRSLQPDQLQSPQRRRIALRSALLANGDRILPKAVLRTEVRTLLDLHIPRLTALPGSRTLAGNSGRALVQGFLSCSPAEMVLRKIGELSPNRLSEIHTPSLLLAILGQRG